MCSIVRYPFELQVSRKHNDASRLITVIQACLTTGINLSLITKSGKCDTSVESAALSCINETYTYTQFNIHAQKQRIPILLRLILTLPLANSCLDLFIIHEHDRNSRKLHVLYLWCFFNFNYIQNSSG